MNHRHLLILGAPRSGTTLLASMIGNHPDAGVLNEDFGFAIERLLSKRLRGNKLCTPHQIELDHRPGKIERYFDSFVGDRSVESLGMLWNIPRSETTISEYLERFESLRLVFILRDGNAVVRSIIDRAGYSFQRALYYWTRTIDIAETLVHEIDADCQIVTFDQLVTGPDETMRRLADFLGLDYRQEMVDGYKFNPTYPDRDGIEAERAERGRDADYDIRREAPDYWETFERLGGG